MDYDAPKPAIIETKDRPAKAPAVKPVKSAKNSASVSASAWGSPAAHRLAQTVDLSNSDQAQGAFSGSPHAEPVKPPSNQDGAARHKGRAGKQDVEIQNLSDDELLSLVFQRAKKRPSFAARVTAGLPVDFQAAADPAPPSVPLPDRAPRLWADRPAHERGMNAAEWIREVYAQWLGQGLARHHVGELDPELGRAYSMRVRKERHPEDTITEFAEGNPYGRLEDAEALRRRRASSIESKVKARKANTPHFS